MAPVVRNIVAIAGTAAAATATLFGIATLTTPTPSPTPVHSGGSGSGGSGGSTGSGGSSTGGTTGSGTGGLNTTPPTTVGIPPFGTGPALETNIQGGFSVATQASGSNPADAEAILQILNNARVAAGVPPLAYDARLNAVAQVFVQEAKSHTPPEVFHYTNAGLSPVQVAQQVVPQANISYANLMSFDFTLDKQSVPYPQLAVDQMLNPPGSVNNQLLLSPAWNYFGGMVNIDPRDSSGSQWSNWVIVFAKEN